MCCTAKVLAGEGLMRWITDRQSARRLETLNWKLRKDLPFVLPTSVDVEFIIGLLDLVHFKSVKNFNPALLIST